MFGTQWWGWFAKWTSFGEIQIWYDLVSVSKFQLCLLKIRIWK
jgi:hypothetical protein